MRTQYGRHQVRPVIDWIKERRGSLAAGVVSIGLAVYALAAQSSASHLERANTLGLHGNFQAALAEARRAGGPFTGDGLLTQAYALIALGRPGAASDTLARAEDRDPQNWVLHFQRAVVLGRLHLMPEADREMAVAHTLNPLLVIPPKFP